MTQEYRGGYADGFKAGVEAMREAAIEEIKKYKKADERDEWDRPWIEVRDVMTLILAAKPKEDSDG